MSFLKLKIRNYFAYLIDKYIARGALVRVINGHIDIERRPYIDLLIKLPDDVEEYDPTEILERLLHEFNYGESQWRYGGGFAFTEPLYVCCDITPSVQMVSNRKRAHCP